jgi:hypothetical protein
VKRFKQGGGIVFANITKNVETKFSKICVGGGAEETTS